MPPDVPGQGDGARVVPFMRLVPNGVTKSGKLKATLIVTPQAATGADGFPIAEWPSQIVDHLKKLSKEANETATAADKGATTRFRLRICGADPCTIGITSTVDATFSITLANAKEIKEVVALWKKAIEGDVVMPSNPWTTLRDDINRSMTGTTHDAKQMRDKYGDVVPMTDDNFHDSGSIIAAPHDPTRTSNIRGVVANAQAKFATETEAGRAQRISAKFGSGPYLPGDPWDDSEKIDDGADVKNKDDALTTGSVSTPRSDKEVADDLKNKRKQKLYDRLKASITNTDVDRGRSAQSFNAVQRYLGIPGAPAAPAPAAAPKAPDPPSLVAPKQNVHGRSTIKDRASHIYGSWAQRSSPALSRSANGMVCTSPDAAARIHGVYYSLQGDPILSRFFGFAFEIEFNRPGALLSGGSLWLAAADATEQIWTKASYYESGTGKYFWPASRFEGNSQAEAALAVEQTNGVFNLGLNYDPATPASGPRYDLTSLDVRGAVSGARNAQDLGQRYHTIGWTLLDRGRADQTARDLAISDAQNEARKAGGVLVLHAEELTVGRRLDVKAWRADGGEWRSLMNRFVEFTNLTGEVKSYLDRIVIDRRREGRILDESSFQLMARSMPTLTADGQGDQKSRPVEAVVEEAIQTWDGTPLAVLARKSGGSTSCETSVLPIKRAYDLPRESLSHLRPPPLRYGVGYIFGIRSVFLGGGSPTIDEARQLYDDKQGALTLPPSENCKPRPRQYLRHEGIDAPILMLPSALVVKQNGKSDVMGFEPPGQAIVRSLTPSDPVPPGEPSPGYIGVADRVEPHETLRVFVAPMVGFDFASRHRVFDDTKTAAAILRGGLLDVDFDEEKPRFPVAVVKRNPGFNGEKLVYRREIGWPSAVKDPDSDGLGATVFKPRPPANRKPAHGYLPDPAAQTMSLRLRICGADNYLEGDVLVDLYGKGITYPHALPLAVTVKKCPTRTALAKKITDVVTGDGTAIMRLGENGKVVPDSTGKGVRVRHLTILLAPAEQFDLEVTCLPTCSKLTEWFSLPETIGVQLLTAKDNDAIKKDLMDCCGDLPLLADLIAANSGPASRAGLTGKAPPTPPGIEAISKGLLSCIQNKWPLTELASPTTLRVMHAVNAPKDAPSLQSLKILRPGSLESVKPAPPKADDTKPQAPAVAACPAAFCSTDPDLVPGSATMLMSGEILVDLEQADTIDIVATVVNASGKPFDDANRGRGILAKRTGQWPRFTSNDGKQRLPVPVKSVLGFDVDPDGKTNLLHEVITLLRIQSLPDPRAACNSKVDGAPQPFKPLRGRLTPLDLRALHLAAISGSTITLPIALPPGATAPPPKDDGTPSHTRTISVTRPHELSDTRARQLELRAVAFSRFAAPFETAPRFSADGEEHVLHRRQPLQPQDQTHTGASVSVWSPSTERPAACAAKTPTPFFSINRCAKPHKKGVMQVLERDSGVRLRFDRGMFSSGEGERIAIVLWPPNIREQSLIGLDQNWVYVRERWMQLSNFDDADLGDGGKFISRWGGDPIRSDPEPQKGFFMPWSAFDFFDDNKDAEKRPHDPQYVGSARMPVCAPPTEDKGATNNAGKDKKGPVIEGFLEVSLLTFEPYFDIDREEWFVDVPIRLARASDPFVRFGLVRYQPNSVCDDLKVSPPVRVWTQLPPRRHVSVTNKAVEKADKAVEKPDISVQVLVRGQASDGVKPIPASLQYLLKDPDDPKTAKDPKKPKAPTPREVWERLQRPKMTLRLVHEAASTSFGRQQTDVLQDEPPSAMPKPVNGEMLWTLDTTITAARIGDLGPGRIFAIVEEVEERLAASYPNEPIELMQVLKAESLRESGPRFLARIPFLDV
ncbi:hypothetical protein ABID58_007300 [Bradyrhizobium sp. S3.2.6]|uniref:hypothetical protein n=1 Tax=Bradyrhizobium sp. S3.2.6 TaxID=3156428 RepID=UPI003391792D